MTSIAQQVETILAERSSEWDLDYGQVQVTDEGNTAEAFVNKVRGDYAPSRWVIVNLDEDHVIDIHV